MPIDKAKRDEWRAMVDACDGEEPASGVLMTDADLAFFHAAREAVPALLDKVERLEREVEARPNLAEVETCHGILRRVRSAAGIPDRYPSFAAKPPSDSDGEEIATRVAAALSLLREIEWSATIDQNAGGEHACPCCLSGETEGHAPDCRLAALLR